MVGDAGDNQLLGRPGADTYHAAAGNDSILANSANPTRSRSTIDCGEGFDTAQIDSPENGPDAAPSGCEAIEERVPTASVPPTPRPHPKTPAPLIEPHSPTATTRLAITTPPRTLIDARTPAGSST